MKKTHTHTHTRVSGLLVLALHLPETCLLHLLLRAFIEGIGTSSGSVHVLASVGPVAEPVFVGNHRWSELFPRGKDVKVHLKLKYRRLRHCNVVAPTAHQNG